MLGIGMYHANTSVPVRRPHHLTTDRYVLSAALRRIGRVMPARGRSAGVALHTVSAGAA
ncbi:hypothetical protein XAB3213_3340027 [Xanthomonas citri pv. bilvae]|nr:hypothetical protein XAB3213_3340027 [Xanthomonas citri pv. bilvae]